jgi:mannose-6-phosphate isomerase
LRLYPLLFEPRFKERVWGGRMLETLYGKPLPAGVPIGESWEISDRPGDESVIANGSLAGQTLHQLMTSCGGDVLGAAAPAAGDRFPVLCKILDAREVLSVQVHPPERAAHLGEPKTEMWYIAAADPGAELYVGLRRGVTRQDFEEKIATGEVADCLQRLPVRAGDSMFLPSGRVHAIGAGLVIYEIQQNSDTTFRVFDWNRPGLDGRPRELHVSESLASIDFGDVEPPLAPRQSQPSGVFSTRPLARHATFTVDLLAAAQSGARALPAGGFHILAAVEGDLGVSGGGQHVVLRPGQFCLVPAALDDDASVTAAAGSSFLLVEPPNGTIPPS